ncbi:MAG: ATP-binding cassette domain-containing protein [Saprospiraceae bacterium]
MVEGLVIEFKNVDICYGYELVLKNIEFSLAKAETCYIVGKSGSGKSSFLKTLYGQIKPQDGVAKVANFDLHSIQEKELHKLRRKIGMVFQEFHLFEDWTVGTNLWYVLEATGWRKKEEMTTRIYEVLALVGLQGLEKKMVKTLSGGQMQQVAIARALLNHPDIIIADEPTGNLDPETSDEILYLLNRLSREQGTTILIATHDYRLIQKFPARIFRCQDSSLIEI